MDININLDMILNNTYPIIFEFVVLIIISFIVYSFDKNKCDIEYSNIILYFHHFVNIFANFGWLSNNKYILYTYLLSPIIVLIHWQTNNNKCILSQLHNRLCNQHEDKVFDDIFNIVQLKKYNWWNIWGHYLYLAIVMGIAIYKITKL